MKRRNFNLAYTGVEFRTPKSVCKQAPTPNLLNRGSFSGREPLEAIVTDLTYVRVGKALALYLCPFRLI